LKERDLRIIGTFGIIGMRMKITIISFEVKNKEIKDSSSNWADKKKLIV